MSVYRTVGPLVFIVPKKTEVSFKFGYFHLTFNILQVSGFKLFVSS